MAVGDVLETRLISLSGDQVSFNVRHYRSTAITGTGAELIDIANNLAALYGPLFAPLMSSGGEFRGVGVRRRIPAPVSAEVFSTIAPVAGTRTGDQMPKQIAGIITLRTGFAGRRFRGRLYVPFPSEVSNASDARPIGTYITDLTALATQLASIAVVGFGANTETLRPIIAHRPAYTTTDITIAVPRLVWATQRRRGSYGARNISPI